MPEKVDKCPYCGSREPHQGPTGCPPIKQPTCIHPGVFATERTSEHCYTCGRDVPRHEL
jgi:hypothetical protein